MRADKRPNKTLKLGMVQAGNEKTTSMLQTMKEIEQTGGQDGAQIAQLYTEKDELLK